MLRTFRLRQTVQVGCSQAVSGAIGRRGYASLAHASRRRSPPWLEASFDGCGDVALIDVHTHIGENDPDGMRCSAPELLDGLALANARGAVFAMHEPDGYPPANDAVIAAAAEIGRRADRLGRLDPAADPLAEAERCLAAGATGLKLHPRAEQFQLDDPRLEDVWRLADAERLRSSSMPAAGSRHSAGTRSRSASGTRARG